MVVTHLVFVLVVALEVDLLSELTATYITLVDTSIRVDEHVTFEVTAGRGFIVTCIALVSPLT